MNRKIRSFAFVFKSVLATALLLWSVGCVSEDGFGPPSIKSFTLNGQSFNTVLVLPDTLAVEALLEDGEGLGKLQLEITPLFAMEMPVLPQIYSLDTVFELYGTSSLVSKKIPLEEDSIFGGLYQASIMLVGEDGKQTASQASAFKVINAKPEFLLANIGEAGKVNQAVPLAFQVRDEQQLLDSLKITIRQRFDTAEGPTYAESFFYQIGYQTFSGTVLTFNEAFSYPDTGTYELNIKAYSGDGRYKTEFKTDILISE